MTNTKYNLYQEPNRLTLVVDNPTETTVELLMKIMGAGIKDLTGLNPVKQEEVSVPNRNPDVQKTVPQEDRKEENATHSNSVPNGQVEKPAEKPEETHSAGNTDNGAQEAADQAKTTANNEYSYEELLEIVKSNRRISEIGPVKIAVAIHPYLTDDEQRWVLTNMCGKTQEEVAGDKLLDAFTSICNSPKDMIPVANGYVRLLRSKEKQSGQQK